MFEYNAYERGKRMCITGEVDCPRCRKGGGLRSVHTLYMCVSLNVGKHVGAFVLSLSLALTAPCIRLHPMYPLLQVTGRPVVVKLNTGVDYRGVLACLDGYMNIAMEQVRVRVCESGGARRRSALARSCDRCRESSGLEH